jgi:Cdc6-like AAA superfamily ATPase
MASIYGKILKSLRLLSKGDVILKTTSDFIGSAVGESQNKTKAILEMAEGCVLVIDEAYGLDDQLYGKQVLDTIVEKVSGKPGEDIAVILIGYDKEIKKMLRDQNPGLARRFDLSYALRFEDFNDQELMEIFTQNMSREEIICPFNVKRAAIKHLAKKRAMKNFGNAGAVNNLVADSIKKMQTRKKGERDLLQLLLEDKAVDQDKVSNLRRLILKGQSKDSKNRMQPILSIVDVVGEGSPYEDDPLEILKTLEGDPNDDDGYLAKLKNIGVRVDVRKKQGRDLSGIVQNFIFTGAPGTGKTTVAKKMAKLLYAFGLLATDSVVETSGLGLTGQYVGQTKKAVEEKMEEARGGVLFIDEAYELGSGAYGAEAMTQLLAMLTMDQYKDGKTVVILAGYKEQIDEMLNRNEGLKSRFDETIHFGDWTPEMCLASVVSALSRGQLENNGLKTGDPDEAPLFAIDADAKEVIYKGFDDLSSRVTPRPGWANARDSGIMFKKLISAMEKRVGKIISNGTNLDLDSNKDEITIEDARNAVNEFLLQRPPKVLETEGEPTFDDKTSQEQQDVGAMFNKLISAMEKMFGGGLFGDFNGDFDGLRNSVDELLSFQRLSRITKVKKKPSSSSLQQRTQDQQNSPPPPPPPIMRQITATTKAVTRIKSEEGEEGGNLEDDESDSNRGEKGLMLAIKAEEIQGAIEKTIDAGEKKRLEDAKENEKVQLKKLEEEAAKNKIRLKEIEDERLARLEAERKAELEEERLIKAANEKRIAKEELRLLLDRLELDRLERAEKARAAILEKLGLENERLELMKLRKKEMLTMVSNCENGYSWNRSGSGWVCAGGFHHVSDATLEREYTKRYPS